MILYLDTTDNPTIIRLYSLQGEIIDELIWESNFNQSEELLNKIDNLISKNNKNKGDLEKIIVVSGPGSFTGVRIGVTTANFLAYGLYIPILGLKKSESCNLLNLTRKTILKNFSKPVLPYYDKGPNITKPRKI